LGHAKELHVLLVGQRVAVAREGASGRLSLAYVPEWQASDAAQSISLSLPYVQAEHPHRPVSSYLAGLLPDNAEILRGWATQFGVSPDNPFALLSHMGEDCAGAVQFVREERLEEVLHSGGTIAPVTEQDIADALSRIRRNAPPWAEWGNGRGMFSLAGAQAKIALAQTPAGWGRPSGRAASTHILKPPTSPQFPGIEINEHVCLGLARHLGIPAASSHVQRFGDEVAIVVQRFDRRPDGNGMVRVHQEDTCQALGMPPERKYQQQGGPGFAEMVDLARTHSADPDADLQRILSAAAVNWIIAGTDAHAKNYSWFLTTGDQVLMTPLYDLISALPYYPIDNQLRLAMPIGGETRIVHVRRSQWERFAAVLGANPDQVVEYVRGLVQAVPAALTQVVNAAAADGLDAGVLERLEADIHANAERCSLLIG
jgi:serine/threonine-protein kinase HipA